MLDERVRAVLARLEAEDARERDSGLPLAERSRPIGPNAGRFLFALVAPQAGCEVLEIGGSRGYSSIWLAAARALLGGRVVSLEHDPRKCEAWRGNVADAGLEEWAELVEGDAHETLAATRGRLRPRLPRRREGRLRDALRARPPARSSPAVSSSPTTCSSHVETLGAYSAARQADPSLSSVTVPLDRGLELSVVLARRSPLDLRLRPAV